MRTLPGGVTPELISRDQVRFWNFVRIKVGNTFIRYTDRPDGGYSTTDTPTFGDVDSSSPFFYYVEAIARNGITAGCGSGNFCPTDLMDRKEMAVWLLKAEHGAAYVPPACVGTFLDVACPSAFAPWIEQLYNENITAGCGGGNFCPDANVTRAQMAVFILKTLLGSTYTPPAASGTIFGDVAAMDFAADWIEDLYNRGITAGCGGGNFCPGDDITRQSMAVFLTRAFGFAANLNIDGCDATWAAFDFQLTGPAQSMASALDVSTISFQNIDNVWSDLVFLDNVRGSEIQIYQAWFDDSDNFVGAMIIFDGRLDDGQLAERAKFSLIPYATPWTTLVPGRTYTSTCQYVFKDKLTCQYVGPDSSCLKTVDDCRARTGGSNEVHFGGFQELPPLNFKYVWGDVHVTPPSPNRDDAVSFTPVDPNINNRMPVRRVPRDRHTIVVHRP